MTKEEFIIFTSLGNYLKELGINLVEFLSKDQLLKYTEFGRDYVGMDDTNSKMN